MNSDPTKKPELHRLRLTQGDVELLYLIFEYRILTGEQIAVFLGELWQTDRGVARRLQKLERAGFIINPPEAPSRYVYVVGDAGADMLRREFDGIMPKTGSWNAKGKRLRPSSFNVHDRTTVDFIMSLEADNRTSGEPFFIRQTDIMARINLGTKKRPFSWPTEIYWNDQYHQVAVRPDAAFGIAGQGGEEDIYFLETDMGTEPQMRSVYDRNQTIMRKILSYAHSHDQKVVQDLFGIARFTVIFTTTSERRLTHMQELYQEYAASLCPAGLFYFVTHDQWEGQGAYNVQYQDGVGRSVSLDRVQVNPMCAHLASVTV